ncbi:ribulose-phosphate 3-epimerase [Pediococcus acidilactici]|uniref:Ribulose-phosphate 3-epimerase n=1 Tax=Lactiplantibacillus plantarum TaxID=1590 RepID=A0A162EN52_LACPN|nr:MULTISPECIES: ribulose-phosphate 3-epimerase [Lactobacillaceae]KZU93377.1 Ribulose-phosphate 3-epimerase [Lactiplantibacillus plantarum]MCJ2193015.1 ribulose-phosphate 3-epimerase [Pediococcus acidilactici]MPQ37261.1 ribulose-phosphate 3-epimerase [Lactiplantibacillus plantarum]
MYKVAPSLMVTDLSRVGEDIKELDNAGVEQYHIDIMDGHFVPNFTLGPDFVKKINELTNTPLDLHLMIENPENFIDMFYEAGADMISIHAEATNNLEGTLQKIQKLGMKAGVAINPATPLSVLDYIYPVIDYVLVMTVNPGFAGQKFIPAMYQKIADLRQIIDSKGMNIDIEVDGNLGAQTIPGCVNNGAEWFVGGTSSVYQKDHSLTKNVAAVRQLLI